MKTYNEPGKARKQCPNCNVYVHVRSIMCVCKHVFRKPKNEADLSNREATLNGYQEVDKQHSSSTIKYSSQAKTVTTPAGECPYQIMGESKSDIFNWCDNIFQHGLKNGIFYTDEAICYWLCVEDKQELQNYVREWYSKNSDYGGIKNSKTIKKTTEVETETFLVLNE